MRKPRLYTRTVRRLDKLRQEKFAQVLAKKGDIFDENFIEKIVIRRKGAFNLALKLGALQLPIFVFLLFALIPIEANVSIFGVSPTANKKLREILLISSALLGVCSSGLAVYNTILTEILNAYVAKRSKGDKVVQEYLGIAYGVDFFVLPHTEVGKLSAGWGFPTFMVLWALLVVILFACLAVAGIYIHVLLLYDIYIDPSFSRRVSLLTIAFVLLADALWLVGMFLQSGFVVMRNYENMEILSNMPEEKAKAVYVQMAKNYYQKPWLLRILSRPKIPRKIDNS